MSKPLIVIPYDEHEDNLAAHKARIVARAERMGKFYQLRARRGRKGFFVFHNRGDKTFATKGFYNSSCEAVEAIPEFAKALGFCMVMFSLMLGGGGL